MLNKKQIIDMKRELQLLKQLRLLIILVIVFGIHAVANAQVVYQQNESGIVAINAADYTSIRDGSGTSSGTITTGNTVGAGDFLNENYLEFPTVASGIGDETVAYTDAAAVYYTVNFLETGTYSVYPHIYIVDGDADSFWFSNDDTGSLLRWETWTPNAPQGEWTWANNLRSNQITISSTGEHVIEFYLRGQGGPLFDKFVLVKDGESFDGDTYVANANLYNIKVDDSSIYGFDESTLSYDVELTAGTTEALVEGIPVNDFAQVVIKDDGVVAEDGTIDVSTGSATATVEVTSEDESTTVTYTVNLSVMDAASNATLSDLAIDGSTITGFNSGTTTYDIEMPYGTTSAVVTAEKTVADASFIIKDNGTETVDGVIDLNSGSATVTVEVTSNDQSTTNTYTINLTVYNRLIDATLSDLSVDGIQVTDFSSDVTTYDVVLPFETTAVDIVATTANEYANAVVSGADAINAEGGVITITVTAEDDITEKVYTINYTVRDSYKIFTIGDSTVQTYASGYYPRTGWGQVLQYFFNSSTVVVDNRAVGGTSSKSFYNSYWKETASESQIVDELQSGDYVFIQFGINDSNSSDETRYTIPFDTFDDYLTLFVEEAQAKGAIPVLVATLRRNSWTDETTLYPAYHDYPVAARELAATLNVPLIDLDATSGPLMLELGQEYCTGYMYNTYDPGEYDNYPSGNTDPVHFQELGAIDMARLVIEELQSEDDTYTDLAGITQYVNDYHTVTVTQNDADAGLVTRTASYPAGLTVTLKAKINDGYEFVEWQDGSGTTISTDPIYTFTMGSSDLSYTGIFNYVGYGSTELWIEAESGDAGELWNIVDDVTASNEQYVTIESGYTSGSSAPGATGQISYTVNVEAGNYRMFWRVLLPSVSEDSFWMQIDGGTWAKITWDEAYTDWTWKEITAAAGDWTEGEHVITIGYREYGALLDKIHIGSTLPTDMGEEENYTGGTTGINDYNTEEGFLQNIWTDNAQTINISYDMKKGADVNYAIFNSFGQLVYQESLGYLAEGVYTKSISEELSPGIYILKTNADGELKTSKVLIK